MIYQNLVRGPYKVFPSDIASPARPHHEILAPAHGDGPANKTWDQYKVEYTNPVSKPPTTAYNRKSRLATLRGARFLGDPNRGSRFSAPGKNVDDQEEPKKEEEEPQEGLERLGSLETLASEASPRQKFFMDDSSITPGDSPVYHVAEQTKKWVRDVYEQNFAKEGRTYLATIDTELPTIKRVTSNTYSPTTELKQKFSLLNLRE